MKILYVNSLSADYVQDLTYAGLCKIFGVKNIVDYPWNKKYHIPYKRYPKNLGYQAGSLAASIQTRFMRHFDLVIVGAAKVDCFEAYLGVLPKIPSTTPVLFIDGGDRPAVGEDLTNYHRPELFSKAQAFRPFDYVFKREYLKDREYAGNVHPFPMSFNLDHLPARLPQTKKYDVSFWAVESDPVRTEALALLQDQFDCANNGTVLKQKFSTYKRKGMFYLEELAACRIVLNFRGGGWDTMRYWEVPAVGGFLISQRPRIVIPDNFKSGAEIVYCQDDLSDLLDLCRYYLKNDSQREAIATASRNCLYRYHTDEQRCRYMLEKISG